MAEANLYRVPLAGTLTLVPYYNIIHDIVALPTLVGCIIIVLLHGQIKSTRIGTDTSNNAVSFPDLPTRLRSEYGKSGDETSNNAVHCTVYRNVLCFAYFASRWPFAKIKTAKIRFSTFGNEAHIPVRENFVKLTFACFHEI